MYTGAENPFIRNVAVKNTETTRVADGRHERRPHEAATVHTAEKRTDCRLSGGGRPAAAFLRAHE